MAIGAGDLIEKFGTQDSVDDGTTSSIANAAFSVAADVTTWTNDDDAPWAVFALMCQWATLPTDNSVINIHARKLNIQSTNDDPVPATTNTWMWIGSFTVDGAVAINTDTYLTTERIKLPNHKTSQEYDFYLENQSGQTISANWDMWVTPVSEGPHA